MRISTQIKGPSLAAVLAFAMTEDDEDVARVERVAGARMAAVRGWFGWRVSAVDIAEDADNLIRITIHAEPVGPGHREKTKFEFLTDISGRGSVRFRAFLDACGLCGSVDDDREVVGRFFATRNNAKTLKDFGCLTSALAA
ncbi:hypothetical protein D3C87_1372770 [compost metagenome]